MTEPTGKVTLDRVLDVLPEERRRAISRLANVVREEGLAPDALLVLCEIRIAQILDPDATLGRPGDDELAARVRAWPTTTSLSSAERCALSFAEQFVIDVHGLADPPAKEISDLLGPAGFMAFVFALSMTEQFIRLRLALLTTI